ncbi:PleD family two-component system response regulator [Chitinophaga sp. XS-30]|uniref:response regulator n=1 Tax=Chitinophaga sp. XS-30 TaxID=2604421 RepID=UPI0011DCAD28|nr:response regulator [Chitinophaga sp. XS-30]QEH40430.1 response regulator [Chitinophaga sp. XS-30]
MLRIIEMVLRREGYEADTVMNGREAALSLRTKTYDLILIDLKLPFSHLKEMVEQLRISQAARYFPVLVILISSFIENSVGSWFGIDADEFIHKPLSPYDLAGKVNRLLGYGQVEV